MRIKILPIFIVVSLLFTVVNVIATTTDDDNIIKIAEKEDNVSFSQATIENIGEYVSVNIDEANTFLRSTGKPMLPVYTKTFTFPRGTKIKNVECILSDITSNAIDGKIQPSPQPIKRISLEKTIVQNDNEEKTIQEKTIEDESVYSSSDLFPNSWYDYKIGSGLNDGVDVIFVKVDTYPIRYSPVENTLYSVDSIEIRVTYEEASNPVTFADEYDLLIITPNRFKLSLLPLYFHKVKMDVSTKIKTVESIYEEYEGRDKPEQIKYFIKDAKEMWNITYVLLVGGLKSYFNANDKDNINEGSKDWYIPVRYANAYDDNGFISDLYYADLYKGEGEFEDWDGDGDGIFGDEGDDLDLYPDVYYGRLPCRSKSDVRTMVKKIINYERPSIISIIFGKPWMNRMIAVGGVTGWWYEGQPDGEWVCNLSIDYMGDLITDPVRVFGSNSQGAPRPVTKDIIKEFSKGAGYVLLEGHGNTLMWDTHWPNTYGNWTGGITNYHFPYITNRNKLPIVIVGGCHNGLFNVTLIKAISDPPSLHDSKYHTYGSPVRSCFSWKLCTKSRGGAIASTGCTAYGLGTIPPDDLSGGLDVNFFYEIGQNNAKSLGAAHSGSITKYIEDTLIGYADVYVITEYQLFGDPSLKLGGY